MTYTNHDRKLAVWRSSFSSVLASFFFIIIIQIVSVNRNMVGNRSGTRWRLNPYTSTRYLLWNVFRNQCSTSSSSSYPLNCCYPCYWVNIVTYRRRDHFTRTLLDRHYSLPVIVYVRFSSTIFPKINKTRVFVRENVCSRPASVMFRTEIHFYGRHACVGAFTAFANHTCTNVPVEIPL